MPAPYRERVRQTPDLLGYWRMGDTAGATVRDHYHGDTATVVYTTTAPTFGATGPLTDETPSPTAITFDAAYSQYLDVGWSLQYNLSRIVTVEFWIKKASAPAATMAVVSRRVDANFGWEAYLDTSGYVTLWIGDDTSTVTTITSSVSVCDNSWHHVVLVRNGHGANIWIDGTSRYSSTTVAKAIGSMAVTPYNFTTAKLRIGAGYNGSLYGYFTGSLAEVAVYSRALSQAEVTYHYAGTGDTLPTPIIEVDWANKSDAEVYADTIRAASPVAYWRLDDERPGLGYSSAVLALNPIAYWRLGESSGTVADNAQGTAALDGTYTTSPAPTFGVAGPLTGDSNTAVTMSGASNVQVASNAALNGLTNLTLALWVKNTASSNGPLVGKGAVNQYSYVLYQTSGGYPNFYYPNATFADWKNATGTAAVNDGNWHFVVATWDGTTVRIYKDGTLGVGATTGTGTPYTASTAPFGICYYEGAGVTGSYDEVAVWGRALSGAEISSLYSAAISLPAVRNEVSPSDPAAFAGSPAPSLSLDYSPIKSTVPRMCATIASGSGVLATTAEAYVDVAQGTAAFAAEGWFWHEADSTDRILFSKIAASNLGGYTVTHSTTNGLVFKRYDSAGTADTQTGPVMAYGWHHVVANYTGSSMQLYVDGVAWGSAQASSRTVPNTTTYFTVGYFIGKFSDVAIYGRALTATEIARHYDLGVDPGYSDAIDDISARVMEIRRVSGRSADFSADAQGELTLTCKNTDRFFTPQRNLIENPSFENDLRWWSTTDQIDAYLGAKYLQEFLWRMDEASGTVLRQRHGALDGAISAAGVAYGAACDKVPGNTGTGLTFNGSSGYVTIADANEWLAGAGGVTVSVMVKVTARPSAGQIGLIAKKNIASTGWFLRIDENGYVKWGKTSGTIGTSDGVVSTVALTNGVWYHVLALRATDGYCYIYIDGVNRTTSYAICSLGNTGAASVLVAGTGTADWFNGSLKDLAITSRNQYNFCTTPYATQWAAVVAAGGLVGSGATIGQIADAPTGAGARCMSVALPAKKYAGVWTEIRGQSFRVGATYTLSCYLKVASGNTSLTLGVGDGITPGSWATNNLTGTGSWARYTLSFTSPTSTDRLVVYLRNNSDSVSVVYVDAVQLNGGSSATVYLEAPVKRQLSQGSPVRLRATHNGVTYPLFTGVIERIVPNDKAAQPYVTVYARDPLFSMSHSSASMPKRTRSLRDIRRDILRQHLLDGTDNLVRNGDFIGGSLADWTAGTYAAIAAVTDGPPGFGAHAMEYRNTYAGTYGYQSSSAATQPIAGYWDKNTVITLSAWVKQTGIVALTVGVTGYSSNGTLALNVGVSSSGSTSEVWTRVTVRGVVNSATCSNLSVYVSGYTGAAGVVDRIVLTSGDAIKAAIGTVETPVVNGDIIDGLGGDPEMRVPYGSAFLSNWENRLARWGPSYVISDSAEYGSRLTSWRVDPDGSNVYITGDRSRRPTDYQSIIMDYTQGQYTSPVHPDTYGQVIRWQSGKQNEGCWTDLRGSFNKGVTYQFCIDIAPGAPSSWRVAVFNVDSPGDASLSAEINADGAWHTITWSWTPTTQVRRARLSVYVSTYDVSYGYNAWCYFTHQRCIEYGSTLTWTSPANNDWSYYSRTIPTTVQTRGPDYPSTVTDVWVQGANPYHSGKLNLAQTFRSGITYRLTATIHADVGWNVYGIFGAPGDEATAQLLTGDWKSYIFDWTPTADRDNVYFRVENQHTTNEVHIYVSSIRVSRNLRNPPYLPPIVSRRTGTNWQSLLGLPAEEGATFVPDFELSRTDALSGLGWVNAQSGSRHYIVPTLTAPYFYEYLVTTIDESRIKATAEALNDDVLTGLADFVVGAEATVNSVIIHTGSDSIDSTGCIQFTDLNVVGSAGDEHSILRHGYYPSERTLQIEAYPDSAAPQQYVASAALPFRLAQHLSEKYRESRARPAASRINQFPAMLRRMPDDVYEITTTTLGLSGARFSVQSQTLTIAAGGKIWSLDEQLEEM